ncbi:hypothetical protein GWK47_008715 [Chionoecetes opilio]|uniref:Uncharacterized protein n=1 Tax=Chionoecetes opilio TaxID=41210 RepID=A0A8J4XY42_CHIOP|nr:hypothetical protein GWK47_008715 [Chionoecetes opilio]
MAPGPFPESRISILDCLEFKILSSHATPHDDKDSPTGNPRVNPFLTSSPGTTVSRASFLICCNWPERRQNTRSPGLFLHCAPTTTLSLCVLQVTPCLCFPAVFLIVSPRVSVAGSLPRVSCFPAVTHSVHPLLRSGSVTPVSCFLAVLPHMSTVFKKADSVTRFSKGPVWQWWEFNLCYPWEVYLIGHPCYGPVLRGNLCFLWECPLRVTFPVVTPKGGIDPLVWIPVPRVTWQGDPCHYSTRRGTRVWRRWGKEWSLKEESLRARVRGWSHSSVVHRQPRLTYYTASPLHKNQGKGKCFPFPLNILSVRHGAGRASPAPACLHSTRQGMPQSAPACLSGRDRGGPKPPPRAFTARGRECLQSAPACLRGRGREGLTRPACLHGKGQGGPHPPPRAFPGKGQGGPQPAPACLHGKGAQGGASPAPACLHGKGQGGPHPPPRAFTARGREGLTRPRNIKIKSKSILDRPPGHHLHTGDHRQLHHRASPAPRAFTAQLKEGLTSPRVPSRHG